MGTEAALATEGEERRGQPRRPVSWQAGLVYQSRRDAPPIFGTVIDMGRAGVAFVSEVSVNERSRVIMAIRLPSDNAQKPPIEVQAEGLVTSTILTRAGFRSGINFKNFITGEEEFLKRCP